MVEDRLEVVHVMKKQIVIHIKNCIKIKAKVYDGNRKVVGRITRVFGPVSNPYALINFTDEVKDYDKLSVRC